MPDASYDVVMVGGGNKGLVAAMYLTKYGGMSVGIFEDKPELGGSWDTEEALAPGFLANICAQNQGAPAFYHGCTYSDFPEWVEYGVGFVLDPVAAAVCFRDGTWVGLYSEEYDPTREKTAELVARFSQKDAETLLWLYEKIRKYIFPAMMEWAWNPAKPLGVPDAMDKLFANPESGLDPLWGAMSAAEVSKQLFDSPVMQLAFVLFARGAGVPIHLPGSGVVIPLCLAWLLPGVGTMPGGTHAMAHAAHRIILENGGKVFTRSPVQKIIVENGAAKGIRLEDGTEIEARKAVLSGVDPYQLVVELVGEEHWDPKIANKIKNLTGARIYTNYSWALHERPRYIAEDFNPDLPYTARITLEASKETGLEDLMEEVLRGEQGIEPDMEKNHVRVDAHLNCPGYAPPGKAQAHTEVDIIRRPVSTWTEEEWKEFEKRHADDILRVWSKYAPNMTWDNVIGYVPVTSYYLSQKQRNYGKDWGTGLIINYTPSQSGRSRPIPELASGRMPIKNLYATGAAWHPYPGAHSFQGYNVYKVMAEDFGLRKPWEEKGRPY